MLWKRYESTEVDRRTWLHVPLGLTGPPAVMLTNKLKYKKRLLKRCIQQFKSDLINNMDHTRISGTFGTKVSWNDDSHHTGVVKPVYGTPTFRLTVKAV